MKVFEGTIITCDDKDTVAKYLVEDGGKIVFIGNEVPAHFSQAEVCELGKKALVPSFTVPFFPANYGNDPSKLGFLPSDLKLLQDKIEKFKELGFLSFAVGTSFIENSVSPLAYSKLLSKYFSKDDTVNIFQPFIHTEGKQKTKNTSNEQCRLDFVVNSDDVINEKLELLCKKAVSSQLQVVLRTENQSLLEKSIEFLEKINKENNSNPDVVVVFSSDICEDAIVSCRKNGIKLCLDLTQFLQSGIDDEQVFPLGKIVRNGVGLLFNFSSLEFDSNQKDIFYFLGRFANSKNESEKLSVYEILRSFTSNASFVCFQEKKSGSLEIGKNADFLVLSDSPYNVDKKALSSIKIEDIYHNGNVFTNSKKSSFDVFKKMVYNKNK